MIPLKNLLGCSIHDLEKIALSYGELSFRGKQIYNYIYNPKLRLNNIDDLKTLPSNFRNKLKSEGFIVGSLKLEKRSLSNDGTLKILLRTIDGDLLNQLGFQLIKITVCVSSQVGCPMDAVCATGKRVKEIIKACEN